MQQGASAEVYQCSYMGEDVAVKVFKETENTGDIQKEIEILFELRHPK